MIKRTVIIISFALLSACTFHRTLTAENIGTAFSKTGVHVSHNPKAYNYWLRFPKSATFKQHSAVLSPQLMVMLDRIVRILKNYPSASIVVHGYSDKGGHRKANLALSERRAHSAISYIESQGIQPNRLITHSHGEFCPRYQGTQDFLNRRIEVSIHYKPGYYKDHHC